MTKRKMLISIALMLVLLIGFGCIIMLNWHPNESNPSTASNRPTINPANERVDMDQSEESHYGLDDAIMCMEYPNEISYPGVNQFNVLLSVYPADAVYCKVFSDIGRISKSKIDLEREKLITYYLPDNFDRNMFDVITFRFYDEYSRFIKDYQLYVQYDENRKRVQILEMEEEI